MSEPGYVQHTVIGLPPIARPPKPQEIIAQAARDHRVTVADILGDSRLRLIVRARWDAMARLRAIQWSTGGPRYSMPHIGKMLGGKDHTTVLNGLRRWQALQAAE